MSNEKIDPQNLPSAQPDSVSESAPVDASSPSAEGEMSWVGMELDADQLFEQWSREDQLASETEQSSSGRFSVGRSPLMLILVAGLSIVLSALSFPALEALIKRDQFIECGDVGERRKAKTPLPLTHLERCQLSGFVGTSDLFRIGRPTNPDDPDMLKSKAGVSYVVKLSGDHIYAILPANNLAVDNYYSTQGDLAGFGIDGKHQLNRGLIVDPEHEITYQPLEREIRSRLGVMLDQQLWFFDVTYDPWDHKMPIIIAIIGPIIALLSLLALKNELALRRKWAQEDEADEHWIAEFNRELSPQELEEAQRSSEERA